MGLTSDGTLAAVVIAAVAAVVATDVLWNRIGWLRWPVRFGLLVTCQLTAGGRTRRSSTCHRSTSTPAMRRGISP